nr:hypothetical protein JVH1_0730 [Rhodococcus sp. JVH1]
MRGRASGTAAEPLRFIDEDNVGRTTSIRRADGRDLGIGCDPPIPTSMGTVLSITIRVRPQPHTRGPTTDFKGATDRPDARRWLQWHRQMALQPRAEETRA